MTSIHSPVVDRDTERLGLDHRALEPLGDRFAALGELREGFLLRLCQRREPPRAFASVAAEEFQVLLVGQMYR